MLHIRGISLPQCTAPAGITIVGRKATAGNRLRKFVILHNQPSSPSRTRCIENTFDRAMPGRQISISRLTFNILPTQILLQTLRRIKACLPNRSPPSFTSM